MSKITLEITEVVNGVSITETPITLVGDTLSAAASTTATGVTFTPAGGIAATNVQTALAELDTEKMPKAGGSFTGDVSFSGTSSSMSWDKSADQLKFNDGVKAVFGAGEALTDADLEIFHVSNESYIRDTGSGTLFIQTDGPGITLGSTANNAALSATFVPGGASTLYDTYRPRFTTSATGSELTGQINLVDATFPSAATVSAGLNVAGLVEFDSLSGTGAIAITDILDEDNMASNSDTALATQQSIKAYVDNQVAGKDNSDEITEGSTNLYFTNARADARADARIAAATTTDLSEGSNLYFTDARADARIAAATTTDLSEGSNLYFTNARADARIAAATTTDLTEGTQLYFTNTRADARIAANLIDEDGFGTNSATRAPSQQSVKAYVDAQVGAVPVGDITSVTAGTGLSDGGSTGDVTLNIDSTVVTKTGTQTLTNKTLTSPDINTPDIDGGTIDGTVIGGTTPAAGNFTSLEATGQVTVEGSVPSIVWNDTDGNERSSIFHTGGVAYYTSTDSDETFGQHRFRRDTQSGDPINIFETFANGDVKFYGDDGTSSILKTDAVNGRVGINTSSPQEALDVVGTARATQFKTGSSIIREDTNKTAVNWEYTGKEFSVAAQEVNPGAAIFGDNGTKLYVLGTSADRVQQYSVSSAYDLSSTVTHVGQSPVSHGGNPQDVLFSADGSKIWTLDGGSDQLRYYTLGTNWDITSLSSSAVATRDFTDNADTNPTGFRFNADGTKIILVGSSKAGASGKDIIYSYNLSTPYDITGIGTTSGTIAVAPDAEVRFDSFTDSLEMMDEISLVQAIEFSVDGKTAHIACRDRRNIVSFALATAFDITTMSFAGFANTANEELGPTGIHLTESANVAIVVGLTDDTIVQYTVNNPGTIIDSSGSTQVTGNLGVYKNATFEKDVYISGRLRTASSIVSQSGLTASGNVAFNTLGGTVRVGGTSSTGVFEFGRSTKTQTIEISAGTTESGETNTVNIGNAGASGSTTNINVGGGSGTCIVKLANLPTHANEAAAVSAGLAQDTVYKTSTGELRIKL